MKGCGSWLGLTVLAVLLIGPVVGLSLYLDINGVTALGEVIEKRESISVSTGQTGTGPDAPSWSCATGRPIGTHPR